MTTLPQRIVYILKNDVVVKFADETRALKFEKYLTSGSGVEFARRHLR